jgi:glutathione S-transferase
MCSLRPEAETRFAGPVLPPRFSEHELRNLGKLKLKWTTPFLRLNGETAKMELMPKLKLTYFDFHGGRGEPARLALSIGGIPFEDDRVAPSDWPARKPDTPFGALPVLEVDGQTLAQSNAINRYVGKLTDLYPLDPWQAALCDEVMGVVEDINTKLAATFFLPEEEKKPQRKALVEGPLPFYLTRLQQRLEAHGGRYFAGDRLSVADLKVFVWIRHLKSGVLDHVPADLPDRVAPKLVEHYERVKNDPRVHAYYGQCQSKSA